MNGGGFRRLSVRSGVIFFTVEFWPMGDTLCFSCS